MTVAPRLLATMADLGAAPGRASAHPVWLDGGPGGRGWFAARPDVIVEGDELSLLAGVERQWRHDPQGIWVGWVSYDCGADAILERKAPARRLPGVCMRRYPGALRVDGDRLGAAVGSSGHAEALREEVLAQRELSTHWGLEAPECDWSPQEYRDRVARALEHIRAGDTYQVNLSQRFTAKWIDGGSAPSDTRGRGLATRACAAYGALRLRAPAQMGALIDAGPGWIASNSPETLVEVQLGGPGGADIAAALPIKGTRPRSSDPQEDRTLAEALQSSAKDSAEHLMIVDLIRNDLGRVARADTVQADASELWSLPTVHHLVSRISCELDPQWSLPELFGAVFPGGSVTGAPKRRTMEIIDELEGEGRGIYCGAIVVLEPDGLFASIPIRTAWLDESGMEVRSGGGIVIASDAEAERLETLDKLRAFAPQP